MVDLLSLSFMEFTWDIYSHYTVISCEMTSQKSLEINISLVNRR